MKIIALVTIFLLSVTSFASIKCNAYRTYQELIIENATREYQMSYDKKTAKHLGCSLAISNMYDYDLGAKIRGIKHLDGIYKGQCIYKTLGSDSDLIGCKIELF